MSIFKFLWIVLAIYIFYYLIIYLLERYKASKLATEIHNGNQEFVVQGEQHQPLRVAAQGNANTEENERDQDDGDEKKNL